MKALVGAVNKEKALVGAFSVIVQPEPVVEPMEHYTALLLSDWTAGGRGLRGRGEGRHRHGAGGRAGRRHHALQVQCFVII